MTEPEVVGGATPALSYDQFFMRNYHQIVALTAATGGNRSIAEDLAQEAFTKAHRNWANISGYDNPDAWLRRVAINLALSSRRRAGAEIRAKLRLGAPATVGPPALPHEEVWDAVAKLPGRQRAAIALHYLEDRSVADIAVILDCAEATAKVHLHRGRAALHETLRANS